MPPPLLRVVQHLRHLAHSPADDRRLLTDFATRHDDDAFAELVRRHGPMVFGVCRRVLGDTHAAEDAFQATFLVLAREAGSGHWRSAVGPWLYGVAYRLAHKARRAATRRARCERQAPPRPDGDPLADVTWRELRQRLDDELTRLPERLRAPLVLCYLEGRTRDEAAQQLGWSLATLKRRLERGRAILHARLAPHGLSPMLLAAALERPVVPVGLTQATAGAARTFLGCGVLAVPVRRLVQAELSLLTWAKFKLAGVVLAVGSLLIGAGALSRPGGAQPLPPAPEPLQPPAPPADPRPGHDLFGHRLPQGAIARLGTLAFRARDKVQSLRFDAAGHMLLSLGRDSASVWDVTTGRELLFQGLSSEPRDNFFWTAGLAPDGRTLLTLTTKAVHHDELILSHRDIESRQENAASQINLREREVQPELDVRHAFGSEFRLAATLAPDGMTLAIVDRGGVIHLWDVSAGRVARRLGESGAKVSALAFAPRGDRLVVAYDSSTLRVWDVATGRELRRFANPGNEITQLAISADGRRMASVSCPRRPNAFDRWVRVWDLDRGEEVRSIETDSQGVLGAALTPDGATLITCEKENDLFTTVRRYGVATGRPQAVSPIGGTRVYSLAVAPDGRTLAGGTLDGPIRIWDLTSGVERNGNVGFAMGVSTIVAASDRRTAWARSPDGTIVQGELATGRELRRFRSPGDFFDSESFALSPDGRLLAVREAFRKAYPKESPNERTITLRDAVTGRELRRIPSASSFPSLVFAPDGRTLVASTGPEGRIQFWDVATGQEQRHALKADPDVGHLRFLDGGRKLAAQVGHSVLAGRSVVIWDFGTGQELRRHALTPEQSAWNLSQDGRRLVTLAESAIEIHDLATQQVSARIDLEQPVGQAALSPDAKILAVAGAAWDDPAITLWDVSTRKMLRTFPTGHRGPILALTFTPDGKRLVSGSRDTTALVWDVSDVRPAAP